MQKNFRICVKLSGVNLRKAMAMDTVDYKPHATFNSFIWPVFRRVPKIARIFVMPVCPYVCLEQLDCQCIDFHEILYLSISPKICQENSRFIKIEQEWRNLREHHFIFFIISLSVLFRVRNFSDKTCGENQNTHFMSHILSSKIVSFMK